MSEQLLERELESRQRVMKNEEEVNQDIRNIINELSRRCPKGAIELYQELGWRLVAYNGISRQVNSMADLRDMFSRLGRDVALATREMNDSGLFYEEPLWLGHVVQKVRQAGSETFAFAAKLATLPAIQDCNEHERLSLYAGYLEGLQWGLVSMFGSPYGRAPKKGA